MLLFLEKIRLQQQQQLPFVVYAKPNSEKVIGWFQKNDNLYSVYNFTEKGFIFTSFDGSKKYLIPENKSEKIEVNRTIKNPVSTKHTHTFSDPLAQTNFEHLVSKGIQAIANKEFQKVVLSRKESIAITHFNLIEAIQKLVSLDVSAFVYCFYHPKIGTWLGATPEQLVKTDKTRFETVALAGTQKNTLETTEIKWHEKEQKEQQFVTDYIVSNLKKHSTHLEISDPHNSKAGNLWHIKTTISGYFESNLDFKKIIQLVHPTPAVCGVPKEKSKAFITANENYDRSFYTGFLGELNLNFTSDLFVNLRCMQVENTQAHLYIGCGITEDSIPEKEWNESVNKSITIKQLL